MNLAITISAAFIIGAIIQIVSSFNKAPDKKSLKYFLWCFSLFMLPYFYSVFGALVATSLESIIPAIPFIIWMWVFVLLISYKISFKKYIYPIIDEGMAFSVTISFLALFILNFDRYGIEFFTTNSELAAGMIIASIIVLFSLYNTKKTTRFNKWIMYGWYLFVNFIFAVSALIQLQFTKLPFDTAVSFGELSKHGINFFLAGMLTVIIFNTLVHLVFMLYADEKLEENFNDKQVERKMIPWIFLGQLLYLFIFIKLVPHFSFQIVLFWVLITPKLTQFLKKCLKH